MFDLNKGSKNINNIFKEIECVINKSISESHIKKIIRKILKESKIQENIGESTFSFSDIELIEIAKWGLQNEYSSSGCWDDNEDDIDEAVECIVTDFKEFLSIPYPLELGNFPRNPIIYRIIRLKSIDDLNVSNLGYSWFSNPDQHKAKGFFDMLDYLKILKTKDGETYLIKAQTSIDNVDIKNTLWQRSTQWIENEIVIKDDSNSKIKILNITKVSELK